MKRASLCLLVLATASACEGRFPTTPASAYQSWKDRLVVSTGIPFFGLTPPCIEWVEDQHGSYYAGIPTDQCFKMLPPQRWRGLWRNEFEGSRFCPEPARECGLPPDDWYGPWGIWLDVERVSREPADGALYRVEFVGRRTAVKGAYGHLGGSEHALIVDRVISMKQVEPPPDQATQ